MANPGVNYGRSVLDSFNGVLEAQSRLDDRKRRSALQEQQDAERVHNIKRRGVMEERQDTQFNQSQEDRKRQHEIADEDRGFAMEDRERSIAEHERLKGIAAEDREFALQDRAMSIKDRERNSVRQVRQDAMQRESHEASMESHRASLESANLTREQMEKLMPLERSLLRARIAGANGDVAAQERVVAIQKQQADQQQAAGLMRQAYTYAQQGNTSDAARTMSKMAQYGIDVPDLNAGTAEKYKGLTQQLMSGEANLDDPEVRKMTNKMLTASLVSSGRNPERYEVAGLEDLGNGNFGINMLDKESGQVVPATELATKDPDDPMVQLTRKDLMMAAQNYIGLAEQTEAAGISKHIQALAARISPEVFAERKAKGKTTSQVIEEVATAEEKYLESIADFPQRQKLVKILFETGESMDTVGDASLKVQQIMQENPNLLPPDAVKKFKEGQDIERMRGQHQQFLMKNHGLTEAQAERYARQYSEGRMTAEQLETRINHYKTRRDKPAEEAKPMTSFREGF